MKNVGVNVTPLASALAMSASTRSLARLVTSPDTGESAPETPRSVATARRSSSVSRSDRVISLIWAFQNCSFVAGVFDEFCGAPRQVAAGHRSVAEHIAQALAEHVASFGNRLVGGPAMRTVIAAVFDQRDVGIFATKNMVVCGIDRTDRAYGRTRESWYGEKSHWSGRIAIFSRATIRAHSLLNVDCHHVASRAAARLCPRGERRGARAARCRGLP